MTLWIWERHLGGKRTCCSIYNTRQAYNTPLVGILRTILHDKRGLGQLCYHLVHIGSRHTFLYHELYDTLGYRELGIHRCVAAKYGKFCHRRHLIACAYGNLTDYTCHRSCYGTESQVNLSTVNSCPRLSYRCLSLLIGILRVAQHIATYYFLIKKVLVRLKLQFCRVLLSQSSLHVGLCCLQLQLCVTRVDDKQRLTFLYLLTLGHANLHQLSANLWCNCNIVLTFHSGTELERQFNVTLLNCHCLKRRLRLFWHVNVACHQPGNNSEHQSTFNRFHIHCFKLLYF